MFGRPDLSKDAQATGIRNCAGCKQPAVRVFHVTHHYYKGIPSGRSYQHRCDACGATFETLSAWRVVTQIISAVLILPLGLLFAGLGFRDLSSTWWLILLGLLFAALGGWIGWTAVRSILNETRNGRA